MPAPDDAAAAIGFRNKITAQKGRFTREEVHVNSLPHYDDEFSIVALDKLCVRLEIIEDLFDELVMVDVSSASAKTAEMEGLWGRYTTCSHKFLAARHDAAAAVTPGGRQAQFREQNGLKPGMLSPTMSPPEMQDWVSSFRQYFGASNMELLKVDEQLGYFFARMEPALSLELREDVTDTTTLDDCVARLADKFLELYPLFHRRLEWFQLEKGRSQSVSELVTALNRAAANAEISGMTFEDWKLFRFLYCCRNEDALYLELLKVESPTWTSVVKAATAFEAAQKTREMSGAAKAFAPANAGSDVRALADERGWRCNMDHAKGDCIAACGSASTAGRSAI
jgi:hypothetical protein